MVDHVVAAFDPETFRARGRAVVDLLADHLARAGERALPVLPWREPGEALGAWPIDDRGGADPLGILARAIDESNHLHHPRYVGHQVTSPLPLAALAELVAALLNNGMAVYEMGPASTAMERNLVAWMAGRLGLARGDGVLTHGGSAGNLTALLAMRQACAGFDAWGRGAHEGPPLALLASEQTHYSVKRSVQIMGWGERGAVPVPVDDRFRLVPGSLAGAQRAAEAEGRRVVGVVASAESTATGAFDPIHPIADYCEARGLWPHVDGAHGASLALSDRHRARLEGIERADSVVWDLHKMMLAPALATACLFKDGARSYEAFAQEASYLFSGHARPEDEWYDGAARTIECTKRMIVLGTYLALATHGARFFGDYVAGTCDLAARFAAEVQSRRDFELAVEPECNIVCFRLLGPDGDADDQTQSRVRARINASGAFYLVQTRLPRGVFLRVTIINPRTTEEDLDALLDAVAAEAARA
jgi:L-2,4-diaminobutyrate decarboxylase